jgi:hypothetical protein
MAAARKMSKGLTWDDVRRIALAFPGVEEGTSYGTPAFRASKKFLTRLKEDGKSIVVKVDMEERALLMELDSKTFFITEHYRAYPAMLVNLATAHADQVRRLLEQTWRGAATKKLLAAYDETKASSAPVKRSPAGRRRR